jgi:ATP-binding cassette subfamily F protein uup
MNYLSVENLSKSYGEKVLFESITFGLSSGEKVGLVAKNGAGKSTLLKILIGQEISDSGKVIFKKDIRVAFLQQDPTLIENGTIIEYVLNNQSPIYKIIHQYEKALETYSTNPTNQNQKLLEEASLQMELHNAWDVEQRVKQMLFQFNITNLNAHLTHLSGGEKKRIALCKTLIENPDLLILDEPTNHLDLEMIEWLENYLIRAPFSLLLVTHDRYFLNRICSKIIELDNKQIYTYNGNYEYFIEKKAEREAITNAEIDKAQNTLRKELEWMRRMPKARTTKSKSRIEAFYELKERASQRKIEKQLQLQIKTTRLGSKIIEVKNLTKSFGNKVIVNNFSYNFKNGERIGIIGPNGIGKTTFINLLMGLEKPDSGHIAHGETVVFGYYSQKGLEDDPNKRVIEVIKDIAEYVELNNNTKVTASQLLTMFLFSNDMQYAPVGKLSGGEKKRLNLCKVLIKNPNFLVLDEPTNDLDLITIQLLEEFLLNFKGCLLIVSHDRYFMDKLTQHLFVFKGNGMITDYWGNYTEYREELSLKQAEAEIEKYKDTQPLSPTPVSNNNNNNNNNKTSPSKKLSFKQKQEIQQLEQEINSLEEEKKLLTEKLSNGNNNHTQLLEWSKRIEEITFLIDTKTERWLELQE